MRHLHSLLVIDNIHGKILVDDLWMPLMVNHQLFLMLFNPGVACLPRLHILNALKEYSAGHSGGALLGPEAATLRIHARLVDTGKGHRSDLVVLLALRLSLAVDRRLYS